MLRIAVMLLALALSVPMGSASAATIPAPVIEYYNASLDHYFITWAPAEIAKLDAGTEIKGWARTGQEFRTFTAVQGGASPVCRYYIPPGLGDSHFFGRGTAECDATGQQNPSFVREDPAFMQMFLPSAGVCPSGTTEIYRVFSNRPDANHRYMTDKAIRAQMVAKGWLAEGDGPELVVMCAPPDPGPETDFNPTADTTIAGLNNFGTVVIPAGVTVTMTGDVLINASGAVTIAGNLVGDCKVASIAAGLALNVTGKIENHCAVLPGAAPPALTLVGDGGVNFTNARVSSSGDVLVTNDLAASQGAAAGPTGLNAPAIHSGASMRAKAGPYLCTSVGTNWLTTPLRADNGADGNPKGKDGMRARTWVLWCDGNGLIDASSVFGQDGGHGGAGTHSSNVKADTTGGAGGAGGLLSVFTTGQLDFGSGNVLNGGNGGEGGDATATSVANPTLAAAPPATATSGRGGAGGLIAIQSLQAMTIAGPLSLNVGSGGASGDASALAAEGLNSSPAKPAQPGGNATATSGDGGKVPRGTLTAAGNITGAGNVTVTGGPGGTSGVADATGGKGGDGVDVLNKDGAVGGTVNAFPGRGGNAEVRNMAGALVGNGGNSGDAVFRHGLGGHAFNDCAPPLTFGGKGGNGGATAGGSQFGGSGAANGMDGKTREIVVANGGNGGHGLGPGKRGEAGANGIVGAGAAVITPPVFTPGAVGRGCRFTITILVILDPLPSHEPFVGYTSIGIIDALVNNDTSVVTFTGEIGGKWITVSGPFNKTTGAFTATGNGTAAGFANVPVVFAGTITFGTGQITGEVTLGGGAVGLPAHSVNYSLSGTTLGVSPPGP